ncbi:MAG: hypothetical protein ABEJ64_02995 [Candidatus Nanohaloarchaea archaeon]
MGYRDTARGLGAAILGSGEEITVQQAKSLLHPESENPEIDGIPSSCLPQADRVLYSLGNPEDTLDFYDRAVTGPAAAVEKIEEVPGQQVEVEAVIEPTVTMEGLAYEIEFRWDGGLDSEEVDEVYENNELGGAIRKVRDHPSAMSVRVVSPAEEDGEEYSVTVTDPADQDFLA